VNNGSGFPAPYNQDSYSFEHGHSPLLMLSGGYVTQYSLPAFTNYTYNSNNTSYQMAYAFGVGVDYQFSDRIILSAGY
jgi:hypothetical protein